VYTIALIVLIFFMCIVNQKKDPSKDHVDLKPHRRQ